MIDAVARGAIGHSEAIRKLHLETAKDLVETMHANGRTLWAHRPTRPSRRDLDVVAIACGLARPRGKPSKPDEAPAVPSTNDPTWNRDMDMTAPPGNPGRIQPAGPPP